MTRFIYIKPLVFAFAFFVSLCCFGQEEVPLERYVCPSQPWSNEMYEGIEWRDSDGICNSGTKLHWEAYGQTDIIQSVILLRQEISDGPFNVKRLAQLLVQWKPNRTGRVSIKIWYERKEHVGWGDCDWEPKTYMYTYIFNRGPQNPGGGLTASTDIYKSNGELFPLITSYYKKGDGFTSIVPKIRWRVQHNNDAPVEKGIIAANIPYWDMFKLQFQPAELGTYVISAEVQDVCDENNWFPVQSRTIKIEPSCYRDVDASNQTMYLTGPDLVYFAEDNTYRVKQNTPYRLNIAPTVTDFYKHYTVSHDGNSDISVSGTSYTVHSELGGYYVSATKKAGRESCPDIPRLAMIVGHPGSLVLEHEQGCSITLPDEMDKLGYEIDALNPVFKHFAYTVKSERNITIKPGVTFELGAELILEVDPLQVPDQDKNRNFTESTLYNEYGEVVSMSRSYFDDNGNLQQTQSKNSATDALFVTQTLYDAQNRPAITTLPAPVTFATGNEVDNCGEEVQLVDVLDFKYKEDFVKAADEDKTVYNYLHFDKEATENNPSQTKTDPIPLDQSTEGTLGWYYSGNNTLEPYVGTTQYPYVRTLYKDDGTGEVKGSTRPGDQFRAGSPYIATGENTLVTQTDPVLTQYMAIRNSILQVNDTEIAGKFFKSVSYDIEGNRSEAYTDLSGHTVVSVYYGKSSTPISKSYSFFDLAGRLQRTISPNGVRAYETGTLLSNVDQTRYFYNSKGLLEKQQETDGGVTSFVYRRDGKVRFSQNGKQKTIKAFSYVQYDKHGRTIEGGEYVCSGADIFGSPEMNAILENISESGGLSELNGIKRFRIFTTYDRDQNPGGRTQRFVRNNISSTRNENATTYFSYDERGRVEWVLRDIVGLGVKTIDYRYEEHGNLRDVVYQKGQPDQFAHYYEYDATGRLVKAYTTTGLPTYNKRGELENASALTLQATYQYYLHGPLKRVELANKLQGIDYTYTVDGMLKSINAPTIDKDPGNDSPGNNSVREDVFGMSLEYFSNDYAPANNDFGSVNIPSDYPELHNGNIRAIRWHSPIEKDKQFAYAFTYDNKYQFRTADWGTVGAGGQFINNLSSPLIESTNLPNSYKEAVIAYDANGNEIPAYDDNGNIRFLNRYNGLGGQIANYKYNYVPNTNKLDNIVDASSNSVKREYQYNEIGQLTKETGVNTRYLEYDVSGKVVAIYADESHTQLTVSFTYDDKGFRLSKSAFGSGNTLKSKTWYVTDASGSLVATYEHNTTTGANVVTDQVVYGSGKVGVYKPEYNFTLYELVDHLGNVRAVIGKPLSIEYLATMESERLTDERADLEGDFTGIRNDQIATDFNHTPPVVQVNGTERTISNPNEVLRMNNMPTAGDPINPVGAGIRLLVHPGDIINAEVFVKYTDFNKANQATLPLAASLLSSLFFPMPEGPDLGIFDVVEDPSFANWPAWADLDEDQPRAFLNCLLYDNNGSLQLYDFDQVSIDAKIMGNNAHDRISLSIPVDKEGFIYIFVSNHSNQNTEVYFDDLRVTQQFSDIVAGGDYYPYGLSINDRQIKRDFYRFGYQGQYSEYDEESGLNHFELREYDPSIGRWTMNDPAAQYFSPYIGMGNNPVNGIDRDGGKMSPIYNKLGNFLGYDSWGEKGTVLVFDDEAAKQFVEGMDHDKAVTLGKSLSNRLVTSGFLSADIFGKIATNEVGGMPLPDEEYTTLDVGRLHNGLISVAIEGRDKEGKPIYYTSNGGIWSSKQAGTKWLNYNKEIMVTYYGANFELTRANLRGLLGIHEFLGHGMKRMGHRAIYELQRSLFETSPWDGTTERYRNDVLNKLNTGKFD